MKYYVLAVDLTALAVIVGTVNLIPVQRQDLLWFAGLVAGSMLHLELSRQVERMREIAAEGASYVTLKAVWSFAGLVLLPPPLVVALIAVLYAHEWLRVSRRIVVHRWIFSACTVVLASAAAGAFLVAFDPAEYPGLPAGTIGFVVVAAAASARWLVNYALVVGVIALSSPGRPVRQALGRPADQLIEAAALGLGYLAAVLVVVQPAGVLALLVPLLVMQRSLMVSQLEHAASVDSKTGLLNAMYWHELAKRELERAERMKTSVGILMIDVDRFKNVNQQHGQLAGDKVLRAVAAAVKAELPGRDVLVARLAGEEFVALLPNIDDTGLAGLAERICQRVRELSVDVDGERGLATVRELTVSVGGSLYPDSAADLDGLLLTADNALFSAKDAGRNGFCLVAADPTG